MNYKEYYFIKKYLNRFQAIIYINIDELSNFLIKNSIFKANFINIIKIKYLHRFQVVNVIKIKLLIN
jgi:hypothetical protein